MIHNSNWVEPCARRAAAYRSIIRTAPVSACWAAPRAARPDDASALPRTGINVRGRTGRVKTRSGTWIPIVALLIATGAAWFVLPLREAARIFLLYRRARRDGTIAFHCGISGALLVHFLR